MVPTGVPGLRLRFYPGVRPDLRLYLLNFARWLRRSVDFRHPVRVTVVPQATVMGLDGAPGWAVFLIPADDYVPGDVVRIFLAGGKLTILETRYRLRSATALARVAHDFAHEVVHYEQWRDRQRVTERGVNRRAETLVRTFTASLASSARLPPRARTPGSPPTRRPRKVA